MNTDTHTSGSTVKNHISLKTVFGYSATQRTSFRSWFQACHRVLPQPLLSSTSMTPSRQEIDHPTSSSRSSTSPPMTSSTVSSERVARQERGDPCGIDHYPATVSSERVERHERGDLCSSEISEELLTKPTKNPKQNKKWGPRSRTVSAVPFRKTGMAARIQRKSCGWRSSWTQRLTRKFFSWIIFRALRLREVRIWVNTVFILTSLKTEIARSARGPKSQGHRAEDALAASYLVQKILVTRLQQIIKSLMTDVNLETITGTLSWYNFLPLSGFNLFCAKQRLHMRRKIIYESVWSRHTSQKSCTLTTHWNLENHLKIKHGITALQHLNDPRQMASLRELFDE